MVGKNAKEELAEGAPTGNDKESATNEENPANEAQKPTPQEKNTNQEFVHPFLINFTNTN